HVAGEMYEVFTHAGRMNAKQLTRGGVDEPYVVMAIHDGDPGRKLVEQFVRPLTGRTQARGFPTRTRKVIEDPRRAGASKQRAGPGRAGQTRSGCGPAS